MRDDPRPVRGRRRCVSPEHEPWHPRRNRRPPRHGARRSRPIPGRPIAILADLQGPKLRVGVFAAGAAELEEGARFRLDLDPRQGDAHRVCLPHPEIFAALLPGATLLVNDGKIRLKVEDCGRRLRRLHGHLRRHDLEPQGGECPRCGAARRGAVGQGSRRSGIRLQPRRRLAGPELRAAPRRRDRGGAHLARGRAAIVSKIEKPSALKAFDEILAFPTGSWWRAAIWGSSCRCIPCLPIQKRLVRKARAAAKPVIVATQMLESMISSPMPTRAEVSDVATAIYEGADAVMLSAESAAGAYPVEAVQTMHNVALSVEATRPGARSSSPRAASSTARRRRHRRRGARDRRDDRHQGDLLLHRIGLDRWQGGARAPLRADPRAQPQDATRCAGCA
jgi:pyruvate kinase